MSEGSAMPMSEGSAMDVVAQSAAAPHEQPAGPAAAAALPAPLALAPVVGNGLSAGSIMMMPSVGPPALVANENKTDAAPPGPPTAEDQAKQDKHNRKVERKTRRRNAINAAVERVQAAQGPAALLKELALIEESLPAKLKLPYHKYALPYEAITSANVALRLFALDRAIAWDRFPQGKSTIQDQIVEGHHPFRPRWQTQPRCMADPKCCGPLWHLQRCQGLMQYQAVEKSAVHSQIRNLSRHPEIIDARGLEYIPRQGVALTLDEMQARIRQWHADRPKPMAPIVQPPNPNRVNPVVKPGPKAPIRRGAQGDESEDELSDEDHRVARTVVAVGNIDNETPYRPRREECTDFIFSL